MGNSSNYYKNPKDLTIVVSRLQCLVSFISLSTRLSLSGFLLKVKPLDVNRYATKKTIAQGMLDIALLTANANQLKYIIQVGDKHEFYRPLLVLIATSILLQVIVGAIFLIVGGLDIKKEKDQWKCLILNDISVIVVFLITVINIAISGFGFSISSNI
ncbi:ninjurin-2-like isoform X2 [Daktulosphaira vitifoliae]|uniref:ninjurin-2-like isoform X2 n=1 Tax=Daktulosphaira vitifoliae TaxID=58002 RepID=UPI0021AA9C2E|nr:ninjurin-2-like isoform X2 [Daktulosphaira vitifoliae]